MSGRFQEQIPQNLLLQEEFQLYDYPSEIGLLATLLRTPAIMPDVERQIRSDQFNLQINRTIYEVMVWMYQQAARNSWPLSFNRIQLLTSAQQVSHHHHQMIATQQGIEHLHAIEQVAQNATPDQMIGYMQTVVDRACRVQQFRLHRQRMLSLGDFTRTPDPRAAAVETEMHFGSIGSGGDYSDDYRITPLGGEWSSFMDKAILNRTFGQAGLFNVGCPLFPFWMSLMNGGFRRRGMTIVAARPKVGKSTMLLCIAIVMSMMGIPTLYMDSEMSREEMFSRALSNISLVMEHNLIRGRFAAENGAEDYEQGFADRNLILQWLPYLQRAPLYYVNVAGKGAEHIASMMRQFRNSIVGTMELIAPHNGQRYTFSNPAMCIYDWMKLPDPAGGGRAAREFEALGYYASALKDSAFSLDMPLAAGAQNNRGAIGVEGEDWETMAESFVAGSDRLAQFCTQLAILRNLSIKEEDLVRQHFPAREGRRGANALHFNQMMHVVFQRGGSEFRSGVPLHLDRGYARYTEMAHDPVFEFCREHFRRQRPQQARAAGGLPSQRAMNAATTQAAQGQANNAGAV